MLNGMHEPADVTLGDSWVTYGDGGNQGILAGAVAKGITRMTLALKTGTTVRVPLVSAAAVGEGIHFFALQYPDAEVASIDLYASNGELVDHEPFA
jgi:hypothetical protein